MSMSNSLKKLTSCVLIDLDGTLINTGNLRPQHLVSISLYIA